MRSFAGTVLVLALVPNLGEALGPCVRCSGSALAAPKSDTLATGRAIPQQNAGTTDQQPLLRLRGGALIDKRTPTYWPILPAEEIPEDGSVGGHYTMEEVCAEGGGQWIGASLSLCVCPLHHSCCIRCCCLF